jgi:hypothetical protein
MRSIRQAVMVQALVLISAVPAAAQSGAGGGTNGDASGVRDSARLLDRPTVTASLERAADKSVSHKFKVIPGLAWADGLNIQGLTAAYINQRQKLPFQLRGGVKRIDIGDTTRQQFAFEGKVLAVNAATSETDTTQTRLTFVGEYKRTQDVSRRLRGGVALEQTVRAFTFGANAEYVNAKVDGQQVSVDAVIPSVGVTYAWDNSLETSFDYAFDNDVDGEDDYSFTVAHPIKKTSRGAAVLVFGVGKHRAMFASLVLPVR